MIRSTLKSLVVSFAIFAPMGSAFAFVDADNSKLVIAFTAKNQAGVTETHDCKISIREMANFDGRSPGKRYTCAQIPAIGGHAGGGEEATPESLGTLVELDKQKKGSLKVSYTGVDSAMLLKTFQTWQNHLATKEERPQALDWTVAVATQNSDRVILSFTNAKKKTSFEIPVTMNFKIPKKPKKDETESDLL